MRFLPALAIGLCLLSATARAEEPAACPAKTTILTLSEAVLADREKLPRLKARGFGAEAAYLKIRYGGLSLDAAGTLAHGLREAGVREAVDLAGALDATRGGFDAVSGEAQLGSLISTVRAILERGDAEKLLSAIAAAPSGQQVLVSQRVVPAVADWPDDRKAGLAAAAGRHGLIFLQAGLVATEHDPDAWADFAAAMPQPEKLQDLAQVWSWAPALAGNPALPRLPIPDAASAAARRSMHTVLIAAVRQPERDFLMTYLNQTGDIAVTEKAAKALLAEIDAGRIRPDGLLDPAWLMAYRTLRGAVADPASVDRELASIPFFGGRPSHAFGPVSARDVIDRLIAVDALAAFLKGEAAAVPAMPAELSAGFQPQWPAWAEVAGGLKMAPLTPLAKDAVKASIVAELLFAAGDHARLADFVLAVEPLDARLALATDFAMRLDRGCASTLHYPAEALLLAGQPIFRFDPAK